MLELQNAAAVGFGTGNKQPSLQTQWGVTVAPAVAIVLLNRRRKRPIRSRLENNRIRARWARSCGGGGARGRREWGGKSGASGMGLG